MRLESCVKLIAKCTPREKKSNTKQSTKTFQHGESGPHAHMNHTTHTGPPLFIGAVRVRNIGLFVLYKKDRNKEVLFWPDMNVRNIREADRLSCYKASRWRSHDHRTLLLHVSMVTASTEFSC